MEDDGGRGNNRWRDAKERGTEEQGGRETEEQGCRGRENKVHKLEDEWRMGTGHMKYMDRPAAGSN